MKGRVLSIAGSDSGGGAGIQADVKTCTALGAYAATAITAVTVQNTRGVSAVWPVPADIVRRQIAAVMDDIGADAIKLGMLCNAAIVEAVADWLDQACPVSLVVDPVMVSTSGHPLMDEEAVGLLQARLLPRATVITPNLPEAAALCGFAVDDVASMHKASAALLARGSKAVLLKGGHLAGDQVTDLLTTQAGTTLFADTRLPGRNTHGTGCTLASAVAAGLAQGMMLHDAVVRARRYVRNAILTAPGFGSGAGPLNHCAE